MRCAKCGHEVDPDCPECPYCASGTPPLRTDEREDAESGAPPLRCCPRCGSSDLEVFRKTFDPGCGCLGLLLFSWWGLLLGFLGADERIVCRNCGAEWRRGGGCLPLLSIVLALTAAAALSGWCGLR